MREIEKVINGEVHTRDSIVERHKGLVHRESHKLKGFAKRVGQDYEDIVSVGFIGLIDAFDKFDGETHDVKFATYAVPLIWGNIQNYLRTCSTGLHYSTNIKQLGWTIRKGELEHLPIDEIAEKVEAKRSRVIHALEFLEYGIPTRLDQPIIQAEGEMNIADVIGEPDDTTGLFVEEFLDFLNDRERKVAICLVEGKTQREIAQEIGVTRSLIWIIKEKIAKKYLTFSVTPNREMNSDAKLMNEKGGAENLFNEKNIELTEEAVDRMKKIGMTYAAIAEHFGISAPTLANRRQNWELERTRAKQKVARNQRKPINTKSESKPEKPSAASLAPPVAVDRDEVQILKEAILRKDDVIQQQRSTIGQLEAERDKLLEQKNITQRLQTELQGERKLLSLLLERESDRMDLRQTDEFAVN